MRRPWIDNSRHGRIHSLWNISRTTKATVSCDISNKGTDSSACVDQVRDTTAFSIHFVIVHHIKITIHLPYCDLKLVYNNNTKIKYTLKDCVVFL